MPTDIQATGFVGLAFETVAGTYTAPTKFFPIRSETLTYKQDTLWRREIRGIADEMGAIAGYTSVSGDIVMTCLEDVLVYFLYASRNTITKTGAGSPWTYVTTPQHGAVAIASANGKPTLSITVVRDGVAFGYTGCQVGQIKFGVDASVLVNTFSIVGRDEGNQTVPASPNFSTTQPFSAGLWNIQVPTATQIFDMDTFEFTVNDNATAENRLASVRSPQFVKFGERAIELTAQRDFQNRTDYDAFKALTQLDVTVQATKGANGSVSVRLPKATRSDYSIGGLANQGDLVRASMAWHGPYDPTTSKSYELTVVTTESIT